jgi:hypothetical protein
MTVYYHFKKSSLAASAIFVQTIHFLSRPPVTFSKTRNKQKKSFTHMTSLKAILSFCLLAGTALNTMAQPEPIIYPDITFSKDVEISRKTRQALSSCGFSFSHDSINKTLLLHLHDPKHFPKIISHNNDKLELRSANHSISLSGKEVRRQLIENYFKINLPLQDKTYRDIFVRRNVNVHRPEADFENSKALYLHYKKHLSSLNISQKNRNIIKQAINKKNKAFNRDYRDFIRILNNQHFSERILNKAHGPWTLIFQNVSMADFTIDFYQKDKKFAALKFDTLYGQPADFLSQYEIADCEPFDRYTYFKRIKGLGLQQYNFRSYRPLSKVVGYKDFTIYFDQNKSGCTFEDIKGIVQLLNDSSYSIRKAKVFAYASVEGDEDNNIRLQKERAQILLDLLQQHNKDSIEIVEFHTDENWDLFYKQIKATPYRSWEDSSKAWIKSRLTDPETITAWGDSLAVQRKAVLQLQMYQDADIPNQIYYAIKDYRSLASYFISISSNQGKTEHPKFWESQIKLLAIEGFLKKMVREGFLSFEKFEEVSRFRHSHFDVLRFYSMMLDDAKGLPNVYTNRENVIVKAYDAILEDLYFYDHTTHRKNYLLRQAIDIQIHTFEQIGDDKLPADLICKFKWPDKPVFYPLILNELDYVHKQSNEFVVALGCYRLDSAEAEEPPLQTNSKNKGNPHAISFDPPMEHKIPHTSYYFFLKKRMLHNDQDIRKLAVRSDDYMEFDLYEFLAFNILKWDVWNNRYYDCEVDYLKMIQLMNKLVENNKILCSRQLFQLYLGLHLRISYLMKHNPDQKTAKVVLSSLTTLQKYYLKNINLLEEQDGLALADHLVWMGKFFHANETIDMARELSLRSEPKGSIYSDSKP